MSPWFLRTFFFISLLYKLNLRSYNGSSHRDNTYRQPLTLAFTPIGNLELPTNLTPAGAPRETPRKHGAKMQTTQRKALAIQYVVVFSNVVKTGIVR